MSLRDTLFIIANITIGWLLGFIAGMDVVPDPISNITEIVWIDAKVERSMLDMECRMVRREL